MQTRHKFEQWKPSDAIPFEGQIAVIARADQLCKVYAVDGNGVALLVAHFVGEEKITVVDPEFRQLEAKCKGNVWVRDLAVRQTTERDTDVVFTTLDRPAKLSPEMQAIQRLARQNEINRERDLRAMESRLEILTAEHRGQLAAQATKTSARKSDDHEGGASTTDQQEPGNGDETPASASADKKGEAVSGPDGGSNS